MPAALHYMQPTTLLHRLLHQSAVCCTVSLPAALHYMQLTTLLPGLALLYLAYNMAKPWAIR
jgi:hypothetical protein